MLVKLEQVEKQYDLKSGATTDKPVVSIMSMGGKPMFAVISVEKLFQVIDQTITITREPDKPHTIKSDKGTLTSHFPKGFIPCGALDQPYIKHGLAEVARLKEEMKQFDPTKQYLVVVPDISNFQFAIRVKKDGAR
jgi:hypothetical protein